jgi:6-phosphogluconate dehydrogenase
MKQQGENFALNMAEHGFKVCVGNRSPAKVDVTVQRAKDEGNLPLVGATSPEDLVAHLKKPRKVIILVQAGQPVDDTISSLSRFMEPGDVIIDGGDEWFPNSIRRSKFLEPKNIHFIAMGMSGGEGTLSCLRARKNVVVVDTIFSHSLLCHVHPPFVLSKRGRGPAPRSWLAGPR